MSIENARGFYLKLGADTGLQQRILKSAEENPIGFKTAILQLAAENGFRFTLEEMKTFMEEIIPGSKELSDNELDSIAGGSKGAWIGLSIINLGGACSVA